MLKKILKLNLTTTKFTKYIIFIIFIFQTSLSRCYAERSDHIVPGKIIQTINKYNLPKVLEQYNRGELIFHESNEKFLSLHRRKGLSHEKKETLYYKVSVKNYKYLMNNRKINPDVSHIDLALSSAKNRLSSSSYITVNFLIESDIFTTDSCFKRVLNSNISNNIQGDCHNIVIQKLNNMLANKKIKIALTFVQLSL